MIIFFVFLLFFVRGHAKIEYSCGTGYIQLASISEKGKIASPFYPSGYPNMVNCVWLLEAPSKRQIELVVEDLQGDTTTDNCRDYLEIRRGNRSAALHYRGCKLTEPLTIRSENRWLWVKFQSDGTSATGRGFIARYSSFSSSKTDETSPVIRCTSTKYKCSNQECIVNSYLCDGVNDCGCTGDCDEDSCEKGKLSTTVLLGVGIGVGSVVFVGIFIGVGLLDLFLKYRADKINKMLEEKAKKRSRRRATKKGSGLFAASIAAGRSSNGSMASLKSLGESQRSDRLRKLSLANESIGLAKEKTLFNTLSTPVKA
ncbi:DgyrCDS5568 [Dimorphilus gyrociliatus]|uniref:DgyrCDS5568 n=1 Tax=Dimorphilus gyrociliatus TaxID=2664684 RepID=A0A7I8VKA1_9ANNE|nr:DgyrCDS5568 [Dimorphilus gyrociliatus]